MFKVGRVEMNILLVNINYKPHYGGIENSFYHMSQEFFKLGHRVHIVAGNIHPDGVSKLQYHRIIDRVDVYRYNRLSKTFKTLNLIKYYYDIVSSYLLIKKLNRTFNYDLVISRDVFAGLGASLAINREKHSYIIPAITSVQDKKSIHSISGNYFKRYLKHLFDKYYTLNIKEVFQRLLVHRAGRVYVFSKTMEDQLKILSSKVKPQIVQPGVDTERFSPQGNIGLLRHQLGLPHDKFIFLIIGRLIEAKGVDRAIAAIAKLAEKDLILLIVGEGPEKTILKQTVFENKLSDKVIFHESTKSPENYYKAADAFVISSIYEPFGQTILEALASGLPVIGFVSDGREIQTATSELIESNNHGILCTYSTEALSRAMLNCRSMKNERLQEIRNNNIQKAREQFSWKNMCLKLVNYNQNK